MRKILVVGLVALSATFSSVVTIRLAEKKAIKVEAASEAPWTARRFYLTKRGVPGNAALNACSRGYHMTSLWEILDVSVLKYDTSLGVTDDDSGQGPPSLQYGWVRTGTTRNKTSAPGAANCNVWTSDSREDRGTTVRPSQAWTGLIAPRGNIHVPISPWEVGPMDTSTQCSYLNPVWCVED